MSKRHFFFLFAACVLFMFIFNPAKLYFLSDDWDSLLFSLQPSNILHSFRPLSDASLLLDYSIWQMNASGFHLTNFILHFVCVFCFYHLSKQLLLLRNNEAVALTLSLTGSLFFLFYPFHSEAIFWIVGRGAILCTLFGLLSFIFFIKKEKALTYYPLSLAFFAAALMSYEEAWIIPVIITILAYIIRTQNRTKEVFQVIGFWLLFFLYLGGRFYFTQNIIGTPYGSQRMVNFNVLFLARNFVAFVFRSFVPPLQSSVIFAGVCLVFAVLLIALFWLGRKRINFTLITSITFFLISLIPVLPLGIDTHDTESERFLYFPSVFFILSIIQFFTIISREKYKVACAFLVAGIIPLWLSYNSFVLSSIITKTTVLTVQKIPSIDTLFCQQLPDQYKGAFIFRNGFKSMIKLEKKGSVKYVEIVSTSELFDPSKNYTSEIIDLAKNDSSNNFFIRWTEQKLILKK